MAGRHALRAHRERQRHRRQEPLGHECDRHADREHEAVRGGRADQEREGEEADADTDGDHGDQARHAVELVAQGTGGGLLLAREAGDVRQARGGTGRDRRGAALSLDDEATGERGVAHDGMGRDALTGQGGRIDRQGMLLVDPEVGADPISLLEEHDIAGDEIVRHDLERRSVPHDGDQAGEQVAQAVRRVFGPLVLGEREHRVEHDHDEDGDAQLREPGDEGEPARDPEEQREEVDHLGGEATPRGLGRRGGQPVGALRGQERRRFRRRQARRRSHRWHGGRADGWGDAEHVAGWHSVVLLGTTDAHRARRCSDPRVVRRRAEGP